MVSVREREQFGPSVILDGTETVNGRTRAEWEAQRSPQRPNTVADDIEWEYMFQTFGD